MPYLVIIVWSFIGIYIVRHHMKKNSKAQARLSKLFWEKEQASLVVRKKALDTEDYITPNLSSDLLPEISYYENLGIADLYLQQKQLYRLLSLKMVNLSHMTNADLRLKYGTAMITDIETYEENYNNYIRCLFRLGKELSNVGELDMAMLFLKEGIHVGTDIKQHYLILASIYGQQKNKIAIEDLLQKAHTLQSLTKASLVNALEAQLNHHDLSSAHKF